MKYHYIAQVGDEQYTFELERPVKVNERVATQGHWLVMEEIVLQADGQKRTGIVKARHADRAG